MAIPSSWSNYAYDSNSTKYGFGLGITTIYKLSDSLGLILNGGYDWVSGSFTSSTTSQDTKLFARYIHAMGGVTVPMGEILPVDSWLEISAGVILAPVIGSVGIPSRNDQFSAVQTSTWAGAVNYVIELELNEYLNAHFGLGYLFIPSITTLLPSLGGGGYSDSVSIALGNFRSELGIAFYF
ncbi:MAG: hypothetical protein KA715_00870 [Xanthomonadaceae bacterium]|nr:hypothetical protein [Xanthomonadaceae bacterium]